MLRPAGRAVLLASEVHLSINVHSTAPWQIPEWNLGSLRILRIVFSDRNTVVLFKSLTSPET